MVENEVDREVKIFVGQGWKSSSELPDQQKLLHCLHYEVQKRQNKLGEHKPIIVVCRLGIFSCHKFALCCSPVLPLKMILPYVKLMHISQTTWYFSSLNFLLIFINDVGEILVIPKLWGNKYSKCRYLTVYTCTYFWPLCFCNCLGFFSINIHFIMK